MCTMAHLTRGIGEPFLKSSMREPRRLHATRYLRWPARFETFEAMGEGRPRGYLITKQSPRRAPPRSAATKAATGDLKPR